MNTVGIILRGPQIEQARAGKRTHLCLPAFHTPGRKVTFAGGEPAVKASGPATGFKMPTQWQKLEPGDKLWVKEERAELYDHQQPINSKQFYKVDLLGGRPPVPGRGVKGNRYTTRSIDARHMQRGDSRYTLLVVSTRVFPLQEIEWDEVKAEGAMLYPSDSKNQWWARSYGFTMPWADNQEVLGLTFEFLAESVDGVPAPDWRRQPRENSALAALLAPAKPAALPPSGDAIDALEDGATDAAG